MKIEFYQKGERIMDNNMVVVANSEDVKKEASFQTLNEMGFVRAESSEHQWYLLLNEACAKSRVPIDEMVRDYLATMLNRFIGRAELFEQLSAFDFYQYVFGTSKIDQICVQDVADMSLQYVAFFPERSLNRHEPRSLEYVANVGTSLYEGLAKSSEGKDDWFSRAFKLMAGSFGSAVIVLRSVCPRFVERQAILREKFRADETLSFLGSKDSARMTKALRNFDHMYFKKAGTLVS